MDAGKQGQITHPAQTVCFDSELIERYGGRGPRYTSYPTALQFDESFSTGKYLEQAATHNGKPLSLYVHIPFCESLCYYCACNKVVTRNQDRVSKYLQHLYDEIALQSDLFDDDRVVEQLHFGGGTPTYLSELQLRDLMAQLRSNFNLENGDHREFSIEVDPRTVDENSLALLRELGFNRLSLGIQDFDLTVQLAVNRIQSESEVESLVQAARQRGFKSISFDLIYGLPHQTVESFDSSLDQVLAMRPDRLAIYNYAHLPNRFKGQRMITEEHLPTQATKLEILHHTIGRLVSSDYCYVGMDHFALPDDELMLAKKNGSLQRNFQGYSTYGQSDLIGLGASAISSVGRVIAQNVPTTSEYEELIGTGKLALKKGIEIDDDDYLRGKVIQELMCQDYFDFSKFGQANRIDFRQYFAGELMQLRTLANDGLIVLDDDGVLITPKGRLLLRSIAMVFDRYLPASNDNRFSHAI